MKVIHYRKDCIGCNACVEHAPHLWKICQEDGKVDLVGSKEKNGIFVKEVHDSEEKIIKLCERDCPIDVIKHNK